MRVRTALALPIALTLLSAAASGCGPHGKPKVSRPAPAAASPGRAAAPRAATEVLESASVVAPGIVEPWGSQTDLAAQEAGWISRILVKEGDVVEAGRLLATLEDAAQRRAVELARGELDEAEAALVKLERGATAEELEQARADYDAAVARKAFARSLGARTLSLRKGGLVADSEVERTGADAQEREALAERADARLRELKRGARPEDRAAARARVATARAKLQLAAAGLDRRRITAPAAGTVLLSRFHSGEFYETASGPLFVLGDLTRLQLRLEVDEIDAGTVAPDAGCEVYSDAGVRLTAGSVVRLAPKMGRRALPLESPTARADVRVREVFVEIPVTAKLVPGQRVWGHVARTQEAAEARTHATDGRRPL